MTAVIDQESKYCPPIGLLYVLFLLALAILFHAVFDEQDEHTSDISVINARIRALEIEVQQLQRTPIQGTEEK
jgi:hypothetical protein